MVGEYSLALALSAPIFMLTNLQLSGLIATDGQQQYPFSTYCRVRVWASSGAVVAAMGVALLWQVPLPTFLVVTLVAVSKAVESGSDLYYGLLQQSDRMREVAASQALRGGGAILALVGAIVITGSLPFGILGMVALWGLALVVHDRAVSRPSVRRSNSITERSGTAWDIVRVAWPLGAAAMLISMNASVPRLFVDRWLGSDALGVFAAMAYFVVGGRMLAVPVAQAAAPRFGRLRAQGDRKGFQRLLIWISCGLAAFGLIGVLGAAFYGQWILATLFGRSFAEQSSVLVILMAAGAMGFQSTLLQTAALAHRNLRPQFVVMAASLASTIILSMWLIPRLGLPGAAWAVLAAGLVEFGGSVGLIRGRRYPA